MTPNERLRALTSADSPLIRGDLVRLPYLELVDVLIEAVAELRSSGNTKSRAAVPPPVVRRTTCAVCTKPIPLGARRVYCSPTCKRQADIDRRKPATLHLYQQRTEHFDAALAALPRTVPDLTGTPRAELLRSLKTTLQAKVAHAVDVELERCMGRNDIGEAA